jgi:hypothetical protein
MKKQKDVLVLTTKFVVIDQHLITYAAIDAVDGTWQFLSDDEIVNMQESALMVKMSEVVKLDASLESLLDMKKGYCASRTSIDDNWLIEKM